MLATPPRLSGHHGRRPLQPLNQSTAITNHLIHVEIYHFDTSNKENIPPFYSTPTPVKEESSPIEPSLADELNAIREKLERARIDKGKTDILLRERGLILDLEMKETVNRGEVQKELEIEVDRLYRLQEIRLACMRISRIRSLRDKEEEKKMKLHLLKKAHIKAQDRDGGKDGSPLESRISEAQS